MISATSRVLSMMLTTSPCLAISHPTLTTSRDSPTSSRRKIRFEINYSFVLHRPGGVSLEKNRLCCKNKSPSNLFVACKISLIILVIKETASEILSAICQGYQDNIRQEKKSSSGSSQAVQGKEALLVSCPQQKHCIHLAHILTVFYYRAQVLDQLVIADQGV